jgi:hypothetical protein
MWRMAMLPLWIIGSVLRVLIALGKEAVDAFHRNDHTHTSPAGVDVVSKAFVKCVVCGNILLKNYVKNEMSTNYDSRSSYLVV